jgi:hypothetical protein
MMHMASCNRLTFLTLLGLAALPFESAAQINAQVTQIEVLESHPQCTGADKIAYRVAFDAKGIDGRFSNVGEDQPAICSVGQRSGSEFREVVIPCASAEQNDVAPFPLYRLAIDLDLSGSIVGCFGLTTHEIVDAEWRLSALAPFGDYEEQGNLSNPTVTVLYDGPSVLASGNAETENTVLPAVWVLILDRLAVPDPDGRDGTMGLTTYLALSPAELIYEWCVKPLNEPERCRARPVEGWNLSYRLDFGVLRDIVTYVEQGRR